MKNKALPETDTKEVVKKSLNNEIIRVEGRTPLHGCVRIQGSKNATLPILAACLLIPGKCIIRNCPIITDVDYMLRLLEYAGCSVEQCGNTIMVEAGNLREYQLPGEYVRKMRSSVILMGALLGRIGEVGIDYPGGCVIGERPIDLHLKGLVALGADITIEGDHIHAGAKKLKGARITFPFSSVGATQNILLASILAEGETCIENAAREPEIDVLCQFLKLAGADIKGIGTKQLVVRGVEALHPVEFEMVPDRIVAGTYLFAAMATKGNICIREAPIWHMASVIQLLKDMGSEIIVRQELYEVEIHTRELRNLSYVETEIYPGFPTDLQSFLLVAAMVANGRLELKESIFSGRFKIVEELRRMGACIEEYRDRVLISGNAKLEGKKVMARELRGGAALVTAGAAACGVTTVSGTEYIDRGYEDIVRDFRMLGARINRINHSI